MPRFLAWRDGKSYRNAIRIWIRTLFFPKGLLRKTNACLCFQWARPSQIGRLRAGSRFDPLTTIICVLRSSVYYLTWHCNVRNTVGHVTRIINKIVWHKNHKDFPNACFVVLLSAMVQSADCWLHTIFVLEIHVAVLPKTVWIPCRHLQRYTRKNILTSYVAVARQEKLHFYAEARPSGENSGTRFTSFTADACILEESEGRTTRRQQVSCTVTSSSSDMK